MDSFEIRERKMNMNSQRFRFPSLLRLGLVGLGSFVFMTARATEAADARAPSARDSAAKSGRARLAQGMMGHVDPETGKIRPTPPKGAVPPPQTPEEKNAVSTSGEGLKEVPSQGPAGGKKVDLKGRFQNR
jgi:hypothetical protein